MASDGRKIGIVDSGSTQLRDIAMATLVGPYVEVGNLLGWLPDVPVKGALTPKTAAGRGEDQLAVDQPSLTSSQGLALPHPRRYPRSMSTLVLESTPELEALKERRRRAGLDRLDEVWEGVLHMVLAPSHEHADIESQLHAVLRPLARQAGLTMIGQSNVGESEDDFRVPDAALHRSGTSGIWHPTAALVIEVVSPDDESWKKLSFYAAHEVDEVLIVDPAERSVHWLGFADGEYRELKRSGLIDLAPAELAERIDWP